ncbi:MAG: hypothetical protein HYY45_15515 [Deltaproteobacteria bacterium]|nr:hypothetical protein [Deltaproteobacteria bacterium]
MQPLAPQGFEERVDKFQAHLGLVVGRAAVGVDVLVKPIYQLFYLKWGFGHRRSV